MMICATNCRDLLPLLTKVRIILFADETSAIVTAQTFEELQRLCSLLIRCFVDWCRFNSIMINITKTECVHIALRGNEHRLVVRYFDKVVLYQVPWHPYRFPLELEDSC